MGKDFINTKFLAWVAGIVNPVEINLSPQFDHRAKFGICFSYRVCTCRRSQKFRGRWYQAPLRWDVAHQLETRHFPHELPYQIRLS